MAHNTGASISPQASQKTINEQHSESAGASLKSSIAVTEKQVAADADIPLYADERGPTPRWWENKPLADKPVDGPYGWVVVMSGFLMLMFSMGCVNSYGSYETYYHIHQFPNEKTSTIAWAGTLQFAVMNIFGTPSGILCERFDTRLVTFTGGLIMAVALIVASFCETAVWKLIITQGIVFGIGASLVFIPSTSIPSQWFVKRRALAIGVVIAGSGIGGLWLTPATNAMLDHLGVAWSLRITGIILFAVNSVASLFMRNRIKVQAREKVVDLSILRDARFLCIFAGAVCGTTGYFTPLFSLPTFAMQVAGKSPSFGDNLLTIINAASTVGRVATGQIAAGFGNINTVVVCTLFAGLSLLVLWLPFEAAGTMIACAIVYGLFCGGFISLLPVIMADLWGVERISTIIGLLYVANFVGTMVGAPSSSAIVDNIGHGINFRPAIVFSGVFMLGSALFFSALRLASSRSLFKRI